MAELPPRIVSGVQPSGELHLGNYFGAIAQFVKMQDEYAGECFIFIADYHAMTTVHDADQMRANVRHVAVTYLACGIDPAKVTLFRQSDVPEHLELAWMLGCVTGTGLLERATSYKDKVSKGLKASVGLFYYPVLMAADILVYSASVVPVGRDQVQHLEMTQDMSTHFNEAFGPILRRPEAKLSAGAKVPGIDGEKMSKSYGNTIPIFLSGKPLKKRVAQIVTDSTPLGAALDPEKCNVFALLELFLDETEKDRVAQWYRAGARDGAPFGYGHAKQLLAEKMEAYFADARAHKAELDAHPERVDAVLQAGAERARSIARDTLERCRIAVGLR